VPLVDGVPCLGRAGGVHQLVAQLLRAVEIANVDLVEAFERLVWPAELWLPVVEKIKVVAKEGEVALHQRASTLHCIVGVRRKAKWIGKHPKAVHYWRSSVLSQRPRRPDHEVSAVKWFPIDAALEKATHPDERAVIEAAVQAPPTNALLIVRHAKAMQRKHWSGDDRKRRLSGRGRDQANRLVDVLAAFGIERLVSSASARCKETLKPYAKTQKISIETYDQLTEESAAKNPKAVRKLMAELLKNLDRPMAVCGHRPVLPEMYAGLAVKDKPMVVSEVRALHFGPDGLVTMETFKPTA